MRKLTDAELKEVRRLRKDGKTLVELADQFKVHFTTIALWTGPEERRKEKLSYKPRIKAKIVPCPNCGVRLHGDPLACDCLIPTGIRQYFFSPKELQY